MELLHESRLVERAGAVQDSYSLRCAPQVHGATRDTLRFIRSVAEHEINAATDYPLFFSDEGAPFDLEFRANWPEWYHGDQRVAYSPGNFHGQPLVLAADFLAIAVSELASISERRAQMMLGGDHNCGLPQNLTTHPGVNSGLMIARDLGTGTRELYQRVRDIVEPVFHDRPLHEDIAPLRAMLTSSAWAGVVISLPSAAPERVRP